MSCFVGVSIRATNLSCHASYRKRFRRTNDQMHVKSGQRLAQMRGFREV